MNATTKADGRTITEMKRWSSSDVMNVCIKRNYYTGGTCAEYERMLDFVRDNSYTLEGLYFVARDIAKHSNLTTYGYSEGSTDPEVIEAIMWELNEGAVNTFYGITEDEEQTTATVYFR